MQRKPSTPVSGRGTANTGSAGAVSLARVLSKLGVASRTTAAEWIAAGRVAVNGKVVRNPAQRIVMDKDRVAVDGAPVASEKKRYLALNKPRGLVTSARDEQGRDTVYDCLREAGDQWLAPVGRLDKASEGLLLFTNDTRWAQRILDPVTDVPKVYHVQVDGLPDAATLEQLRAGIRLEEDVQTRPAGVTSLRQGAKHCWLEITLHEGRNRQIRRMLESVGLSALRLVRIAIGPVRLGELPKGQTRELSTREVQALARSPARDDSV